MRYKELKNIAAINVNKKQQEKGKKTMRQNCYKAFNYTAEELKEVNQDLRTLQKLYNKAINKIYPGDRKLLIHVREKDIVRKLLKDEILRILEKKRLSNLHEDGQNSWEGYLSTPPEMPN